MKNLIIAEHDNQQLHADTLKVVNAASQVSQDNTLLVVGYQCEDVAQQASRVDGIAKVICIDDESLVHQFAENIAPVVSGLADGFDGIWANSSSKGKDLAPRIAAKCGVGQISDIVQVVDDKTFIRPIYAGNAFAKVTSNDSLRVVTVRASAFDPVACNSQVDIEHQQTTVQSPVVELVAIDKTVSERPELTAAEIVISGGRGVGSKENFELIEKVADKLGAAIGASRAAVDAGFVANDLQVGQTGKIVAPKLYIAVGISGAIQHLAGMKESKVIVAINKDPDSPIFEVADYGLVGDLFEILPQLAEQL
ncbi:electron transfer flavoprotein subunit alpha/FixB family protein [Vibrio natriegens]|uniref:Electron transfer flavoprotein subunit alpha n=1 Tax=Vibrio natriegens NBRC 15636 = ATCC 14048 = DSM 759 TaxID=1219067 RepID=A0AAN1CYQ1_VIBNA|nr:FAD-binding protein [Vibrio natriegens]ALR18018.1 electron transfer flavoprotein subunit beta [Vibrio natriegens NBRC 15636 = ATCC 14048 = DSM 759]ANQ15518.1 electron transfer flavoprotein subunit beta [Vibrio natriegens NBRC 15636 = ATCC 14048 = DSM 759]EPM41486.1 electron transfer flavoprotein subunit beta [Vibrio natriegens NBRC 15636 = ATCC 14048 = DSM 759]MDX6029118.1 FAD-binding protein [Vibrio natriegens NBRC 15636 = ATCC 14048 = DSM 759]UUI14175.1 FAD-binding protein [Vibrio natrieg